MIVLDITVVAVVATAAIKSGSGTNNSKVNTGTSAS